MTKEHDELFLKLRKNIEPWILATYSTVCDRRNIELSR